MLINITKNLEGFSWLVVIRLFETAVQSISDQREREKDRGEKEMEQIGDI